MTRGFTRRALLSGLVPPPLGLLCGCAPVAPGGSDEGLRPSEQESEYIDVRVVDRDLGDYREDGLYRDCNRYFYDDQGFLTHIEETSGPLSESEGAVLRTDFKYDGAGFGREIRKYEYKTITVRRDRFVPSIYSNPLGLPACFAPSLPPEMASKTVEG